MHGLPVLEQEVRAVTDLDAVARVGYGLGGTGPVLKTQTIVSVVGQGGCCVFVSGGYGGDSGSEKRWQRLCVSSKSRTFLPNTVFFVPSILMFLSEPHFAFALVFCS